MENKISVITVVYNDVKNIRSTIESFLSQTWKDKEYIIIDGGSTDGTVEIIKEYSSRLAYWCSEKDQGMYDAMNKGIFKSIGDWICILNSGDLFFSAHSLEYAIGNIDIKGVDVIYGNSVELDDEREIIIEAPSDYKKMDMAPIYRHGSSLVKATVQKKYLYDLEKWKDLNYSLDWDMIYRIFKAGYVFKKVDICIEYYRKDGTSNHQMQSLWYNYKITSQGKLSLPKLLFLIKKYLFLYIKRTDLYRWVRAFFLEYVVNDVLPHFPFWTWRKFVLKMTKMQLGYKSFIMKRNYFICPNQFKMGDFSDINRGCLLDARGCITIGNNVSISHNVSLLTGSHGVDSSIFKGIYLPITIEDYAWLGAGCIVLNNVTIGKGAVVCAGAVVTKDVEDYTVVGGIPAKKIKNRNKNLQYHCIWNSPFT